MPVSVINGIRLYSECQGEGAPVVLVHGSWADRPALISRGDQSPPFFGTIVDQIGEALPRARRHTFDGAGHVPHLTHPDDFVSVVGGFMDSVAATRR